MKYFNIDIQNKSVIDLLNRICYTYTEKWDPTVCCRQLATGDPEYHTSELFMNEIVQQGRDHSGAASLGRSHAIKPDAYKGDSYDEYKADYIQIDEALKTELGLQHSALSQFYPKDGFIGWHNNANASGYNLLFTWSETGNGWFKYIDPETKEVVTVPDKPGWQCKAFYYGNYDEPNDLIYHAARTYCNRMTFAYTMGQNEDYWLDCIEELQNA